MVGLGWVGVDSVGWSIDPAAAILACHSDAYSIAELPGGG